MRIEINIDGVGMSVTPSLAVVPPAASGAGDVTLGPSPETLAAAAAIGAINAGPAPTQLGASPGYAPALSSTGSGSTTHGDALSAGVAPTLTF